MSIQMHFYEYDCPSCGIDYDFQTTIPMDSETFNSFQCMGCRQLLVVTEVVVHDNGEQLMVKPAQLIKR